jgi:hypothetical protein
MPVRLFGLAGKDRMHDEKTVQRFIDLRVQGWVFIRKAYHTDPTDPDKSGLDPSLTVGKNALPRSSFGQVLDPTTVTYKSYPDFPVFPVRPGFES